ncbi:MAG: AAA family ATPase, partial [Lachnospiraceae bacterium]|nr:AAA family ATPase [Lachnospiraceae bacterium]
KPAMIVELKYNKSVDAAIQQIKDRKYVQALEGYEGEILLVGVNYDRDGKKHHCEIEKIVR